MNENVFTLTNEGASFAQEASKGMTAIVPSSLALGVALVFVGVFITFFIALSKYSHASSSSSFSQAKDQLIRTFSIPILTIILFSFFSYYGLLNITFLFPKSNSITTPTTTIFTQGETKKEIDTTNNTPVTQSNIAFTSIQENEADVRAVFERNGIKINTIPCTSIGQKSCTTVGGMSVTTINMLIKLKKTCNCDMTISGGTEWWAHSMTTKHRPGNKTAVDLRKDLYLSNFIKGEEGRKQGFQPALAWSSCYSAFIWEGFYFCDEKNTAAHWHIDPL